MNIDMDSPMGLSAQTPNSTASSTIYAASPVSHSYPPPYSPDAATNGAVPAAGSLRRSSRRYETHGRDHSQVSYYGDRYSSEDRKQVRHQRHARSESNGNSSVVSSSGLGTRSGDGDTGSGTASPTTDGHLNRKKQKRNKPTLSCFECVERKTKVLDFATFRGFRAHPGRPVTFLGGSGNVCWC
ncbi:hypothetical protein QBC39DRAFT_137885 [Podospora conica]|nr:hypothetical protein QBC39DRAFT_137885 [Schizothecium conicum]